MSFEGVDSVLETVVGVDGVLEGDVSSIDDGDELLIGFASVVGVGLRLEGDSSVATNGVVDDTLVVGVV